MDHNDPAFLKQLFDSEYDPTLVYNPDFAVKKPKKRSRSKGSGDASSSKSPKPTSSINKVAPLDAAPKGTRQKRKGSTSSYSSSDGGSTKKIKTSKLKSLSPNAVVKGKPHPIPHRRLATTTSEPSSSKLVAKPTGQTLGKKTKDSPYSPSRQNTELFGELGSSFQSTDLDVTGASRKSARVDLFQEGRRTGPPKNSPLASVSVDGSLTGLEQFNRGASDQPKSTPVDAGIRDPCEGLSTEFKTSTLAMVQRVKETHFVPSHLNMLAELGRFGQPFEDRNPIVPKTGDVLCSSKVPGSRRKKYAKFESDWIDETGIIFHQTTALEQSIRSKTINNRFHTLFENRYELPELYFLYKALYDPIGWP